MTPRLESAIKAVSDMFPSVVRVAWTARLRELVVAIVEECKQ